MRHLLLEGVGRCAQLRRAEERARVWPVDAMIGQHGKLTGSRRVQSLDE